MPHPKRKQVENRILVLIVGTIAATGLTLSMVVISYIVYLASIP